LIPKFPTVGRIPVGKQAAIGRHILSDEYVQRLLSTPVCIEEKLDGKTVGTDLVEGYVIYGEWLKVRHSIEYDMLPAWIVGFDVLEVESGKFLDRQRKERVLQECGIPCAPLIYEGRIEDVEQLLQFLDRRSAYSSVANIEGIVVKNYGLQLMGKIVTYEFITGIETHYLRSKTILNRLRTPLGDVSDLAMSLDGWQWA